MTKEYDDVRLKSKGVRFMYPSHIPLYYNYPNSQEAYLYSTPFQEENYYHAIPDERQFGGFPPPFAPPGQGPEAGATNFTTAIFCSSTTSRSICS